MEEYNITTPLDDEYFNYDYDDYDNITDILDIVISNRVSTDVVGWLIVCIGFLLTFMAIYALYSLITMDHTVPIYIINLLISDLIQLCCTTAEKSTGKLHYINMHTYYYSVLVSVGFMVCVSFERYLVIAQPVWYRFRRNIKIPVVVCVVVWTLPLIYLIPVYFQLDFQVEATIFAVYLLLPLPLFVLSLVGTLRALSLARRVPADEKRRIVAILVVVLLIYIVLFLPTTIWFLREELRKNILYFHLTHTFLAISPLADCTLYIFIRKSAIDELLASLCCCKMYNVQTNSRTNDSTTPSCSQTI
ncbi:ovarian cancer G-protein coupled receptor 1-like [Cololabis saira]|uniref:ovarian cancer G-protein coupled receptor 1-like n=1 Tax=Cololabis saira TaxID=129043 RepID=UPI002AD35E60|nr:ovarian cancer G-protein coupled receptor 1-like [Cololabis saira]